MLRSRNKLAEAIELYNMALSLDPTNVTAVNCKGVCYKQMGRNAEAMLCYRDALQMKPDDWRAHNNRGVRGSFLSLLLSSSFALACSSFLLAFPFLSCHVYTVLLSCMCACCTFCNDNPWRLGHLQGIWFVSRSDRLVRACFRVLQSTTDASSYRQRHRVSCSIGLAGRR